MSSITRKKLPRGTKLYTVQAARPPLDAATALSGNISPEQMEKPKGTFRVNLHVPYVDTSFWSNDVDDICYSIPFTLPPFQEDIQITPGIVRAVPNAYSYSPSAPRFYLDEISFGFDQRDEACVIADRFFNFTNALNARFDAEMNFQDITKLNLRLALYEHEMTFWDKQEDIPTSKSDREAVNKEIWGVRVPNVAYAGKDHRLNPVLVGDVDTEIFPHKSYIFAIYAPDLFDISADERPNYALPSITISLKIRTDLVRRDNVVADSVQNIPTRHNGMPTNETVTTTIPAAGAVITADGAGGVSDNLAIVDKVFRNKLKGGYDKNSETVPNQNLELDQSYEIIAVPMFQNRRYQIVTNDTVTNEPYYDAAAGPGAQFIADRRIITLHHPFVLHHVILAYNWQEVRDRTDLVNPTTPYFIPESATVQLDLGVAMGSGLASDGHTYEQMARHTMIAPDFINNAGSTWHDRCIDRIRAYSFDRLDGYANVNAVGAADWWGWELHSVPLEGVSGAGYFPQGPPIFTGKAWSPTYARTDMEVPAAPAATAGGEQFIEVRMQFTNTAGDLSNLGAALGAGEYLLSGYQGHWVYLIGKKAVI
jgi:hypothetical protein